MLYRPYRPSFSGLLRIGIARIVAFVAELHRIASDRAYLDTLDENALRDLGILRIATREGTIYR